MLSTGGPLTTQGCGYVFRFPLIDSSVYLALLKKKRNITTLATSYAVFIQISHIN